LSLYFFVILQHQTQAWTPNLRTASFSAAVKIGTRDICVSKQLEHVPTLNVFIKKAYKKQQQMNLEFFVSLNDCKVLSYLIAS